MKLDQSCNLINEHSDISLKYLAPCQRLSVYKRLKREQFWEQRLVDRYRLIGGGGFYGFVGQVDFIEYLSYFRVQ